MVIGHSDLVLLQSNLTLSNRTKSRNWLLLEEPQGFTKLSKCKVHKKYSGKTAKISFKNVTELKTFTVASDP